MAIEEEFLFRGCHMFCKASLSTVILERKIGAGIDMILALLYRGCHGRFGLYLHKAGPANGCAGA